jgi:hypothetical protein
MIDTPGLNGLAQSEEQIEQFKTSFVSTIPMGRMVQGPSSRRMTAVMLPVSNCS